jgi:hypothetical protein
MKSDDKIENKNFFEAEPALQSSRNTRDKLRNANKALMLATDCVKRKEKFATKMLHEGFHPDRILLSHCGIK